MDRFAPIVVSGCGAIALGFADGGFQAGTWGPTALALAAAAGLVLFLSSNVEVSRLELVVLGMFAALVGWIALSAIWSADASASLREAERALLYLVALLSMLLATRRGNANALAYGVLAAATAVSTYGLVEYVVAPPAYDPIEGTLLFEPLGYANALGVLAAMGALISCDLVLEAKSLAAKVARALPLASLLPTLALTESRGAWVAAAIAFVVLVVVRFRVGKATMVVLLTALAVGGAAVVWSSRADLYGDRPTYWEVAWHDYQRHPALGSGSGTYALSWGTTLTPSGGVAADAHNLYIESLAEVGPVGLALIVAALWLPLVGLRRAWAGLVPGAAYLAFLVHAAVDWDWEMPAVTIAALGCAASLLVAARKEAALIPVRGTWRAVAALLPAAAAIAILVGTR